MDEIIYLDNAATTPLHDKVINEMLPYMKERYGNPSSLHRLGREANNALNIARRRIADRIKMQCRVIFTSGATEANNLALRGIMHSMRSKGKHMVVSSIEHDSILEPCNILEREGFSVTYVPVDRYGMVDPSQIERAMSNDTVLVSVMLANNEVGTIQPLKEIAEIAHSHNAIFHTDAVQGIGKMPFNAKDLEVDAITLSAHKMYGPKGVGALCIRDELNIEPIIHGGGHEYNLRSGTQNVPAIVGMGKAFELADFRDYERVRELRERLIKGVREIPYSRLNGDPEKRIANNAHFTFLGVNGEDLIIKLNENGIAASTGSACSINKQKASHVLKAMGFTHEEVTGSLRLTLGIQNTKEEIDFTISKLQEVVSELRRFSPHGLKYK